MGVCFGRRLVHYARFVGLLVGLITVSSGAVLAVEPTEPPSKQEFHIEDAAVLESSSLASSWRHPNTYWTANDHGHSPVAFALDATTGMTRARVELRTSYGEDNEAIAVAGIPEGGSGVYVGDVGNNTQTKGRVVTVLRFPEHEELIYTTVEPEVLRLRYPDGVHDTEAMLVEADGSAIYLVTKDPSGGTWYATDGPLIAGATPIRLRSLGDAPPGVTDGTMLPDGRAVLRTFTRAWVFDRPAGELIAELDLPASKQGESITFSHDGTRLLLGSEGVRSRVDSIPLEPPVPQAKLDAALGSARAVTADARNGDRTFPTEPVSSQGPSALLLLLAIAVVFGACLIALAVVSARMASRRRAG